MREFDIRPAEFLREYNRLSAEDADTFFPERDKLVLRLCPACGNEKTSNPFEKNRFLIARCDNCGTQYVTSVPTEEALGEFYRSSPSQKYWSQVFFPAVAESRREKIFKPRVTRIRDLLKKHNAAPAAIADVGAGTGMFLQECRTAGFGESYLAVEPSVDLARTCRENGFETFEGFANEVGASAAWHGFADLVVSFEVIEHVISIEAFINDVAAVAKPGGFVLLTGLYGSGFDLLALGENSNSISPPHHLNFVSHQGVSELLARCNLEEIAFLTPGVLDVDIVLNAYKEDPDVIDNDFVRHMVSRASDEQRQAFQSYLSENCLSSHMWIIARKPSA
jgi:SAM-dependent methyltransferase